MDTKLPKGLKSKAFRIDDSFITLIEYVVKIIFKIFTVAKEKDADRLYEKTEREQMGHFP